VNLACTPKARHTPLVRGMAWHLQKQTGRVRATASEVVRHHWSTISAALITRHTKSRYITTGYRSAPPSFCGLTKVAALGPLPLLLFLFLQTRVQQLAQPPCMRGASCAQFFCDTTHRAMPHFVASPTGGPQLPICSYVSLVDCLLTRQEARLSANERTHTRRYFHYPHFFFPHPSTCECPVECQRRVGGVTCVHRANYMAAMEQGRVPDMAAADHMERFSHLCAYPLDMCPLAQVTNIDAMRDHFTHCKHACPQGRWARARRDER